MSAKFKEGEECTINEMILKCGLMGFEPRLQVVEGWWWVKIEGSPLDFFPCGKWRRADSVLGWGEEE